MQFALNGWMSLRRFGARLGPYLLIEILLPGGTLVAVLLYVFRRQGREAAR
jgi:hypothetical protein